MPRPATENAEEALLDAAERLLTKVGYANISTRTLAKEAGVNHGLVHYYFGSMENLFLRVLERFTERLIKRQRAMYAADEPFIEKWRTAMAFIDEDLRSGYPKILRELQALALNTPALRDRIIQVNASWRAVLTEALSKARTEYGLTWSEERLEALVSLVMTFNHGLITERLHGVTDGHDALLALIEDWLTSLERRAPVSS